MASVSATVDGVEVSSSSGTAEALTASLMPDTTGIDIGTQAAPTLDQVSDALAKSKPKPSDEEPDPASEAGKQLAGKRKSMQDRIDQITWEKHEAVRRAEKLEADLKAKSEPAQARADDGRPKLKAFIDKIGTDYDTYEDAVDAHAEALTDFKLAARDTASAAEQRTSARQQTLNAVAAKGRETHADFDAVIGEYVGQGGRFAPANAVEANGPLGDLEAVILQHPLGQSVAYTVAKDGELRARLLGATSRAMFMDEMGTLLTSLKGAPTGSPAKPAPVSKAKPPVQPAKGQPQATGGPPGDDASDDEHLAYYNQQERARRRA